MTTVSKKVLKALLLLGLCNVIVFVYLFLRASYHPVADTGYLHRHQTFNKGNPYSIQKQSPKRSKILSELKAIGNVPLSKSKTKDLHVVEDRQFQKKSNVSLSKKSKCQDPQRPSLSELRFSNTYWQVMSKLQDSSDINEENDDSKTKRTLIFLYGAYLDTRNKSEPLVRILFVSDRYILSDSKNGDRSLERRPNFCQFWHKNSAHAGISKIKDLKYGWRVEWELWGHFHPFLATCELPKTNTDGEFPESVSLVENQCDRATNDLLIKYEVVPKSGKKDFGICVKGLTFPVTDISLKLVQWIEMQKILGTNGIHFYVLDIHPNVLKVLKFYESKKLVTIKHFSLPGFQPNTPIIRHQYLNNPSNNGIAWKQEVIPYNDCFFSNMYKYEYITTLDIDEVILSVNGCTWKYLVKESLSLPIGNVTEDTTTKKGTLCFEMLLFVNGVVKRANRRIIKTVQMPKDDSDGENDYQRDLFMMNEVYEVGEICSDDGIGYKCFHKVDEVLLIHNHYPRFCLGGNPTCWRNIEKSVGFIHHHKETCVSSVKLKSLDSSIFTYNPTILKYHDQLKNASELALKEINSLKHGFTNE